MSMLVTCAVLARNLRGQWRLTERLHNYELQRGHHGVILALSLPSFLGRIEKVAPQERQLLRPFLFFIVSVIFFFLAVCDHSFSGVVSSR